MKDFRSRVVHGEVMFIRFLTDIPPKIQRFLMGVGVRTYNFACINSKAIRWLPELS
jgi:hypothetical protein